MADRSRETSSGDDASVQAGPRPMTGAPRWVKVFGIIALAVVVLIVVMLLVGGNHGPDRHM